MLIGAFMELFDSHIHFDYSPLAEHADELIRECKKQHIHHWLVPGTTFERFPTITAFVRQHPEMYLALGLHPYYLKEHQPSHVAALPTWVEREKPIAIGEIGLDYYLEDLDKDEQQQLFEAQVNIASEFKLPAVVHVRRAHDPVIQTLRKLKFKQGGIIHAYAGSLEQARQLMDLGFCLGFGGAMTYDGSRRIRQAAAELPLEAIVLETDAPDMKPADWPSEHNLPTSLAKGFASLCELRKETPEQIAAQTTANAKRVFRLDSA